MKKTINGLEELRSLVGEEVAVSQWFKVDQASVDEFAHLTGDHQWIHVDPARAASSPFGGTIAHGLYTLSLGPGLTETLFAVEGFTAGLNYGYDRVRFPAPLTVGSSVRLRLTLTSVDDVSGGVRVRITQTFESDRGGKPVCVAEALTQLIP